MAVEIRELIIKAVITSDTRDENSEQNVSSPAAETAANQQVIQECVNQVLKIIKQSQNR